MNKSKIYTRGYGIIFVMIVVSLFFGVISAVVAGSIAAWEDVKKYFSTQVKPQTDEVLNTMKEELKNVD